MLRKFAMTTLLLGGLATVAVSPAEARWWYAGPHAVVVARPAWHYWGPAHCCFGGGVIAGLAVGTAVGVAAAGRPQAVYAPAPYYYYVP